MPSCLIVRNKAEGDITPFSWSGAGPQLPPGRPALAAAAVAEAVDTKRLEQLEKKAKEAFESGRIQGEQAARAHYDEQMERMAQAVAQLAALRGETHRKAELELLELSVAIARRILRREVSTDSDALRGIVGVALGKLQSAEIYMVHVHPQLLAPVGALLERLSPDKPIQVKADANLAAGALLFETAKGTLDVSIETQLKEVERGLIDKLTGGAR